MTEPWILETQKIYENLVKKPKLTDKLLAKPPFKFLQDLISNLVQATGVPENFSPEEFSEEYAASKENKAAFLTKLVDYVSQKSGVSISAKPQKILSGVEPENTNQLLQVLGKIAKGKSDDKVDKGDKAGSKKSSDKKVEKKPEDKKADDKKTEKKTSEKKSEDKKTEKKPSKGNLCLIK